MADKPIVPHKVESFARRHGVDVSKVQTSDGLMTFWDIAQHAFATGDEDAAVAALRESNAEVREYLGNSRTAPAGRPSGTVSSYDVGLLPVDAMARNPLADRVQAAARAAGKPAPSGTRPALFSTGDTPSFCASGIPPSAVLTVPWQARHAMAAAPTAVDAYEVQQMCADDPKAASFYANHPGNHDYQERVEKWRLASMTTEELESECTSSARAELERRESAWTDRFNQSIRDEADRRAAAAFHEGFFGEKS